MDRPPLNEIEKQREYFDHVANQYRQSLIDSPPLHTRLELEGLESRLRRFREKGTILDFGSGTGRSSLYLAQRGYRIEALDISEVSLQALRENARRLGLEILTRTELAADRRYAAIVGSDVLHHLDLGRYLKIFFERLQPGGCICFSEPGAGNPFWYFYLLLVRREWEVERGILQISYKNLWRACEESAFRNIEIRGVGLFPNPVFNWVETACRFNLALGNAAVLKHCAYRYLVYAEKG